MKITVPLFLLLLLTETIFSTDTAIAADRLPFAAGEELTYELRWGIIPAGKVVLSVLAEEMVDGQAARHFLLTAETNSFVDLFYKVRDRIDGFTDLAVNRSLLYRKRQQEGSTRRDITVVFDWQARTARYSNFGRIKAPIAIRPGTLDPFSVLYYCRLLELDAIDRHTRPVTDGKKEILGRLTNLGRVELSLGGTTREAFLLEPEMHHIGGVFEKSREAKIRVWLSADEKKLPLKIESKVVVGSFVAELVSARFAGEDGGRETLSFRAGGGKAPTGPGRISLIQ